MATSKSTPTRSESKYISWKAAGKFKRVNLKLPVALHKKLATAASDDGVPIQKFLIIQLEALFSSKGY